MRRKLAVVCSLLSTLLVQGNAWAQLTAAKDGPVVYGHHHLNVTTNGYKSQV